MLYFIIITVTMLLTTMSSVIVAHISQTAVPIAYALIAPMTVNAYVLVLLGVICFLMRITISHSFWEKKFDIFRVRDWEMNFYKKIHIKQWKDKIPEMGKAGGFPKSHIRSIELKYIKRFIGETCFSEWMHFIVGSTGFTALALYPPKAYFFVLPIVIVNFILNLLPCFIQRYNRYRLTIVFEYRESINKKVTKQLSVLQSDTKKISYKK